MKEERLLNLKGGLETNGVKYVMKQTPSNPEKESYREKTVQSQPQSVWAFPTALGLSS